MHTLRMSATYTHVVEGVQLDPIELELSIGFHRELNGEVIDYWVEDIGTSHRDNETGREVLTWIPDRGHRDPLIDAAIGYFQSSAFAYRIQEEADKQFGRRAA